MTGSTILDTLNSKSISGGNMNTTYARFRLQDIPIDKIYSNDKNFYPLTDIEQLANEIKLCGLMENLTVVKEHCERGDYRLVSGERRWRALTYLVEHGEDKFKNVSAKVTRFDNQNEEELYLIVANSYRTKDSATKMNEVKRMQELLQNAKNNGTSINGYDMQQESIRSVMSKLLGMSETKIAELTVVINHLIDEFMTMLNDGTLGISVAYKIAGMSPDMQLEFFQYCEDETKIALNVVQQFKEKKTAEHEQEQIPGQSSIDDIEGDYDIESENVESDVCGNTQNSVQKIENNILEGIDQEDIEFYETMIEDVLPSNSELAQKAHDELVKLIDYSCEKDYDMALEKWLKTIDESVLISNNKTENYNNMKKLFIEYMLNQEKNVA